MFSDTAITNDPNPSAHSSAANTAAVRVNQRAITRYSAAGVTADKPHHTTLAMVKGAATAPIQCSSHATPGVRKARSLSKGCPACSSAAHCAHTVASPSYSMVWGHAASTERYR